MSAMLLLLRGCPVHTLASCLAGFNVIYGLTNGQLGAACTVQAVPLGLVLLNLNSCAARSLRPALSVALQSVNVKVLLLGSNTHVQCAE